MTSATIGIKDTDGKVRAIRLNADGYPAHAGVILVLHYSAAELVEALLKLGELSQLDKLIAPPEGVPHSWAKPADGVTVAYHRDRGEKLTPPKQYASANAYLKNAIGDFGTSYSYMFNSEKWYFRTASKREWIELKVEVANA